MNIFKKFIKKVSNYNEFIEKLDNSKKNSLLKGKIYEYFCKYMILLDKKICKNPKQVWLLNEVPYKIKKKLNIPHNDIGIDIIIKIENNKYIPVQCKYRKNRKNTINYRELSTFLAANYISNIDKYGNKSYYITNQDKYCKKIRDCDKIKYFTNSHFSNTEINFIEKIKNTLSQEKKEIKTELRECQKKAIKEISKYFEKNNRGILYMACATGKTLIALNIINNQNYNNIIICLPSLLLIDQYINEINDNLKENNYKVLCICSDWDKNNNSENKIKFIKPDDKENINKKVNNDSKKIIICTYESVQSLPTEKKYDFCIIDEAYNSLNKDNRYILEDEKIKINKRLFMTSVLRSIKINDNKELNDSKENISMSNEKLFGNIIYNYSLRKAIEDNIICEYEVAELYVSKDYSNDNDRYGKNNDKKMINDAVCILNAMKHMNCNHVISYHSCNKKAKEFKEILEKAKKNTEYENIQVYNIDSSKTMNNRNNTIDEFTNSEKSIITTSKMLTEGINIPIVDGVYIVDYAGTPYDYVQIIGRCLRKHYMKKQNLGYIFVANENTFNNTEEKENKKEIIKPTKIMKIIDSITSCDEELHEFISNINNNNNKDKNIYDFISKITTDKESKDNNLKFDYEKIKFKEINKNARIKFYKNHLMNREMFDEKCKELKKYLDKHMDLPKKEDNELKIFYNTFIDKKYGVKDIINKFRSENKIKLEEFIKEKSRIPTELSHSEKERKLAKFLYKLKETKGNNKYVKNILTKASNYFEKKIEKMRDYLKNNNYEFPRNIEKSKLYKFHESMINIDNNEDKLNKLKYTIPYNNKTNIFGEEYYVKSYEKKDKKYINEIDYYLTIYKVKCCNYRLENKKKNEEEKKLYERKIKEKKEKKEKLVLLKNFVKENKKLPEKGDLLDIWKNIQKSEDDEMLCLEIEKLLLGKKKYNIMFSELEDYVEKNMDFPSKNEELGLFYHKFKKFDIFKHIEEKLEEKKIELYKKKEFKKIRKEQKIRDKFELSKKENFKLLKKYIVKKRDLPKEGSLYEFYEYLKKLSQEDNIEKSTYEDDLWMYTKIKAFWQKTISNIPNLITEYLHSE